MTTLQKTVSGVALALSLSCQAAYGEEYGWTKVKTASFTSSIRVTGRVTPQEGALNIESARVQGRILNIIAREGDQVAVGAPLFVINSAECLSLTEEARVAEKRQVDDLVEGVHKRAKQLGLNIKNDRCEIVSSYTGSVTKRNVESGATFNAGETLLTVLDTKRLGVEFDISERDLARVHAGQRVEFKIASDPKKVYSTTVKTVVPAIDAVSRTARVRINEIPLGSSANLDGLVFGEVETGTNEKVLVVPSQSVVFNQGSRYVVKGPEASASAVEVDVIGETNLTSSVKPKASGALREGDEVATSHAIFIFRKLDGSNK